MEVIRCSLEDICRPASTEQTGSRVSSASLPRSESCPAPPFSLVVLPDEVEGLQSSCEEIRINSPARNAKRGQCQDDENDDEEEDVRLQRAIEEMRRLDEILSDKVCKEKEIRRQRKELQAKLWQELLQNTPEGYTECSHEALNTRLFLALEAPTGREEEDDFVPVFETQVLDCEHNRDQSLEQRLNEIGNEETGEEQFGGSQCGASKGKKQQKDFVKRNIELVRSEGDQVLFTQAEQERLAELLQDVDEEEEDGARGADSEELTWAESVLTGQGYTPEPPDLKQLIDIDSKIRLLLPVEEFLSVQSSYTNLSLSQVLIHPGQATGLQLKLKTSPPASLELKKSPGWETKRLQLQLKSSCLRLKPQRLQGDASAVGWKSDGNRQPGEKALQDVKTRRGLERRLQEIQQQLEILGRSQEMTNESPELTEEQLVGLLGECELTESWAQDATTPQYHTTNTHGTDPSENLLSRDYQSMRWL